MATTGRIAAGILATAALGALCAHGAWPLLFVLLLPWLRVLDGRRSLAATLGVAWAMAVAWTGAVYWWFGVAIGSYTQAGTAAGIGVLLLAAPLFQPQFIACALARWLAARRHGPGLRALAGSAAWLATEAFVPRLLDDTLGVALQPSPLLRQAADLGGVAVLTLAALLANEALAVALQRRGAGLRALAGPLALAGAVPLLLAGYGGAVLAPAAPAPAAMLRMGLVQANIVDYERLRRERGAGAVVREVLDTHFAMTHDAVERRGAQAVLWSETVYPTTFGQPKSEAGAEFDREILQFVDAARVPLVFGTYARDGQGEYNAAAFVAPGTGLLGVYRKTRLFPFTEQVPPWLDGPALRRLLPWAGGWRPGSGARVMPLPLADGREIPVLPLICLDDMDTALAVDGARQGAQVILALSNDAWFSAAPLGARLHQAAAAMRSVETRLPQFRVTSNGFSAVIDARGNVLNATTMDQRTLVIGEVPVRDPPRTLAVAWGPWPGPAAAVLLAVLALGSMASTAWSAAAARDRPPGGPTVGPGATGAAWTAQVWVLPPAVRWACVLLRAAARTALLGLGAAMLADDGALLARPLVQIRLFTAAVLVPELAAWLVLLACAARATRTPAGLVLSRGNRRLVLAPAGITAVEPWRLPLPAPGARLRLSDGSRCDLAGVDPLQLGSVLGLAGASQETLLQGLPPGLPPMPARTPRPLLYAHARMAARPRDRRLAVLAHPALKFGLLPLLLAVPAFRLHQHIAYGGSFGEWQSFGASAWFTTLLLWWAGWVIGTAIAAAVLRVLVEAATLLVLALRPEASVQARRLLERLGLALLYLGLPAWLALRMLAA